jgi:integrase
MSLNDTAIKALRKKPDRYEVTDRDGLLLEVHPSGKKVWRFRYRLSGRREKLTIGPYPAVGLKEARQRRDVAERMVAQGQSPATTKQRDKALEKRTGGKIQTFEDLAKVWVDRVLRHATDRPGQDQTYLTRDLIPRIGKLKPDEVSANDIWSAAEAVADRGHPQAARRVRGVAKRVFDFALSQGLVRANPAASIKPTHIAPARSRDRVLSSTEIKVFLSAVLTSSLTRSHKLALHFLLLVPARKGELLKARQSEINLAEGTWDIPEGNSKNGAPIRHKLPKQALVLAKELIELAGQSDWLLPSDRRGGHQHISESTLNAALKGVKGPKDIWIHDLRRTVRTGLSELGGVPDAVAELCLNHRPTGIRGVYDRSERLQERARALQRWANHVDSVCSDRNVVSMVSARA